MSGCNVLKQNIIFLLYNVLWLLYFIWHTTNPFSSPETAPSGFQLVENDPVSGTYSVTYTAAGMYVFSCTATDAEGNTGTGEVEVTVFHGMYLEMYCRYDYMSSYL